MGWLTLGIALVSGAALMYEIALTRIFTIAQGYHFGFLAISLALLGYGASGTLLALRRTGAAPPNLTRAALVSVLVGPAILSSYLAVNYIPFDSYRVAWEPVQFVYLTADLLSLTVPFLLGGLLVGWALAAWSERSALLYGANLVGSGAGCLAAVAALDNLSEPQAVVGAALGAALGSVCVARFAQRRAPGGNTRARLAVFASIVTTGLFIAVLAANPTWLDIQLSPYKPLSHLLTYPGTQIIAREGNAFSRLDVVESETIRSAPGLSLAYNGALPQQSAIVVDAENVLPLTRREQLSPEWIDAQGGSLPYRMRPGARALIVEPGGGLEVLVALENGAKSVVAVEPNPLIAELIQTQLADKAGGVYTEPRVRVIESGVRRYVAEDTELFDVVAVALSDNFRAATAGAFTLSENYTLTREAFRSYLQRLAPDGLFVVQRWLQLPPTEELRAAALVLVALEDSGVADAAQNVAAIRTFSTMLILARREPFTSDDIESIKQFAKARQFDLVYYPGIQSGEANRFNVLTRDLYYESFQELLKDPESFYRRYEYEIAPPTDDHPFFFHWFKWEQLPTVLALIGKTWQPFGGSGFLILIGLLVLILLISCVLLVLPVAVLLRRAQREGRRLRWGWLSVYFACLGIGFLSIEIVLIQQFILFLDYPIYAFTAVLFSILVFSGIGSAFSERLPWRGALALLLAAIAIYPIVLRPIFNLLLGAELPVRVAVSVLALAPLGFMMGIPFPRGLKWVGAREPVGIPLAWAVNGFFSVLASLFATLGALMWGFSVVFVGAFAVYAIAFLTLIPRPPRS